jgi:hypothetical protein
MRCPPSGTTAQHLAPAAAVALALGISAPALADEPRKPTEPVVLMEPAEITTVVDAFDDYDPFDVNVSLGYQHTWKGAKIRRETFINQAGLASGGFTATGMNVAEYSETISRLNTKVEIGIFKDIGLIFRLPIILANERELTALDGSDKVDSVVLQGAPGEQLFKLPFKSPKRSGIEYLAVGLDFGIMNQWRDQTKPTWVLGAEGRFSVSEPMHACNPDTSGLNVKIKQVECADPSDINRNGKPKEFQGEFAGDTVELEGETFSGGRSAGVSRGTTALEAHTYLSKRIKYVEPYGGFSAVFEFQNDSSDYGATDLEGSLVNHPPLQGSMILGIQVIPWEIRDQFQRVSVDFRFQGTYRSEGRDYSELFDAIGSSDAPTLRYPNFAKYQKNPDTATFGSVPSVVNPNSQKVYVTGLTDVQQYGTYTFSGQFTWQAGEFVKFNLGGGYTIVQGHLITFDQPCNPDFNDRVNESGPCRAANTTASAGNKSITGIPNPNYRPTINAPGRRFKVDDSHSFDAWLNATVMF